VGQAEVWSGNRVHVCIMCSTTRVLRVRLLWVCPLILPRASPARFSTSADLLPVGIKRPQLLGSTAGDADAGAQGVEEVRAATTLRVLLVVHLLLVDSCRWTWHSLPRLSVPWSW
jgi:hypothetical protein